MISLRSGSAPGGRCGSRSFQVRTDGNHVRWTCRARGRAGGAGMAVSVWAGNRSSRPARRGTAAMVGSRRSRWQTISSTTGAAGASHRPHRPGGVAGGTAPRRRLVIFRQAVGHCAPSPSDRSLPGQTACSVRQGTRAPIPWYDRGRRGAGRRGCFSASFGSFRSPAMFHRAAFITFLVDSYKVVWWDVVNPIITVDASYPRK